MTTPRKIIIILFGALIVLSTLGVAYLVQISSIENKAQVQINSQYLTVDVVKEQKDLEKGLGGRASLGINEGMLFIFDKPGVYPFWMKDMKFAIDIIWVNDNNAIIGFTENAAPQIGARDSDLKLYFPPAPVRRILEVKAGRARLLNAQAGDLIRIKPLVVRQ